MNLKSYDRPAPCQSGGPLTQAQMQLPTHEERIAELEKYVQDLQKKVSRLESLMTQVVGVTR